MQESEIKELIGEFLDSTKKTYFSHNSLYRFCASAFSRNEIKRGLDNLSKSGIILQEVLGDLSPAYGDKFMWRMATPTEIVNAKRDIAICEK